MLLLNAFHNGPQAAGADTTTTAARVPGRATAAATFRQSVIGLEFTGPRTVWGASASGSVFADFYEGNTELAQFQPVRIRTMAFNLDWKSRSLRIAQDKPLIFQRDPTSLSFGGVSPLTSAGNLWRWQPQVRFEQRAGSADATLLRLQGAILQTSEEAGGNFAPGQIERRRPALEGRAELGRRLDEDRRVAVAPGFHVSQSHVLGFSVPSRIVSVDWFANPWKYAEFSGVVWTGENVHHLGSLRQSFRIVPAGAVTAVRSRGGWAQISVPFTPRLSLNLFGGVHDDRNAGLASTAIGANRAGATNVMYRLGPNVTLSLEAMQIRTHYLTGGVRKLNRYDLAIAYLF
jgi:hypothetical protein